MKSHANPQIGELVLLSFLEPEYVGGFDVAVAKLLRDVLHARADLLDDLLDFSCLELFTILNALLQAF